MATRAARRTALRKTLRDWYRTDTLAAAISSLTTTSITASASSTDIYQKGGVIKIGSEEMLVTAINSTTKVLTVMRGWLGTTPATAAISAGISIFETFSDEDLNECLASAVRSLYNDFFLNGVDTSLTIASATYDYAIPTAITTAGGQIVDVEVYTSSDARGEKIDFNVTGSRIYIYSDFDGTARIHYIYPYTLSSDDVTDDSIPSNLDDLIKSLAYIEAFEMMMIDRDKYERYTSTVWREASQPYEIDSNLRNMRNKAQALRDQKRQGLPGFMRR